MPRQVLKRKCMAYYHQHSWLYDQLISEQHARIIHYFFISNVDFKVSHSFVYPLCPFFSNLRCRCCPVVFLINYANWDHVPQLIFRNSLHFPGYAFAKCEISVRCFLSKKNTHLSITSSCLGLEKSLTSIQISQ